MAERKRVSLNELEKNIINSVSYLLQRVHPLPLAILHAMDDLATDSHGIDDTLKQEFRANNNVFEFNQVVNVHLHMGSGQFLHRPESRIDVQSTVPTKVYP